MSDGGLFSCLVEKGIKRKFGFDITSDDSIRKDAFLFGEAQSRVVVSVSAEKAEAMKSILADMDITCSQLGTVTDGAIRIDGESFGSMVDAIALHNDAITSRLK